MNIPGSRRSRSTGPGRLRTTKIATGREVPAGMNIVVCVKHVPDATADRTFNAADSTVDRTSVDGLLSELDEYAVEEALKIRDAGEGEVTILTVGPEQAAAAIRKSLQMGADKGIHVIDDAIHGSDAVATSLVLAKTLERTAYDLVLCGMSSTDGSMGVVPAMLAERLGLPQLTLASEVSVDGSTVTVQRDGDVATETVQATTPLVLSVTDQINEPRYPSFKGIMAAKKKPVDTFALADLGLSNDEVGLSSAWTRVDGLQARPPRSAGTIVKDQGDGATKLVEFLTAQKFI
jgi:electron transfer flavoprotein beta subunit